MDYDFAQRFGKAIREVSQGLSRMTDDIRVATKAIQTLPGIQLEASFRQDKPKLIKTKAERRAEKAENIRLNKLAKQSRRRCQRMLSGATGLFES